MSSQAVDPSQLGLTSDEISLLRQGQSALAQQGSSSSRAASRASSQGLLLLDSGSLAALGRHFDRLMNHIQQQLERLSEQSQLVTMQVYDQSGQLIDNADAEIARFNRILQQIGELENDFDRISHIREIVRGFRQRAEDLERELDRSEPSSSRGHRDGHHSGSSKQHRKKDKH